MFLFPHFAVGPNDVDASETLLGGSLLHVFLRHSLTLLSGLLAAHLRSLFAFYCLTPALLTSYLLEIVNLSHRHALLCHLALLPSLTQISLTMYFSMFCHLPLQRCKIYKDREFNLVTVAFPMTVSISVP